MTQESKENILTVPNFISISRVLLIPVFAYMILLQNRTGAFLVFLIAGATDFLDGLTARMLKQRTKLGALLDPAGDKLFMTAGFILLTLPTLNSPNLIPLWLTGAVIARDLYIVTGSFYLYRRIGQKAFPPTLLGKTSTVSQFFTLFLVLLFNVMTKPVPYFMEYCVLTLILTILSGIQYTRIGQKWYQEYKENKG